MWRRNVLFISLPSQPSSTNGLGTRACLMGSSNSPLVSKEAMQPWKPDFDSKGRGNVLYMWGRTPPAKNFNTIIVRKAVELEFDSTSTQFHLISCQFLQLNWVGLGLENATSLVMSKSSNHMVKPCLQVAKDLSGEQQMHLLISPPLCLLLVMRLPHNYFRTASKWDCCTKKKKIPLLHASFFSI